MKIDMSLKKQEDFLKMLIDYQDKHHTEFGNGLYRSHFMKEYQISDAEFNEVVHLLVPKYMELIGADTHGDYPGDIKYIILIDKCREKKEEYDHNKLMRDENTKNFLKKLSPDIESTKKLTESLHLHYKNNKKFLESIKPNEGTKKLMESLHLHGENTKKMMESMQLGEGTKKLIEHMMFYYKDLEKLAESLQTHTVGGSFVDMVPMIDPQHVVPHNTIDSYNYEIVKVGEEIKETLKTLSRDITERGKNNKISKRTVLFVTVGSFILTALAILISLNIL